MSTVNLKLSIEEVNVVLQTLGQLPTSSGAYPLLVNIKLQADKQIEESNNAKSDS
jgi:hypothetical protein